MYIADDGSKVLRSGGSRSWRNNNPGNLRFTEFSRQHGAIGSAGGFAVFPDIEAGRAALTGLLHGQSYINRSIYAAIARYAPSQENDTDSYRNKIAALTGLDINLKLRDLTDGEFDLIVNAIQTIEGFFVGMEKPVRKVISAKTDGKRLTAFRIEGSVAYISKDSAINLADDCEIDAVVVRPAGSEAYLRGPADGIAGNNFNAIAIIEA